MLPENLTLSNVLVAPHLSHETLAFTAQLDLAGQPLGTVENDGQGGCHLFRFPTRENRESFERLVAEWNQSKQVRFEADNELINRLLDLVLQ